MLEQAKLSCFADEIDTDLQKQIALLNELGISYIEFRSANHKGVAEYTLAEAEEVRAALDQNNISVSAIGSPIGKINITDDFEPHYEQFQHITHLAEIFGTPLIRMFSFYLPQDGRPETYRDEVFRRIDRMVEYAAKKNLILLHENEKKIYGDTASACQDLMQTFYGDNFKATFDFANFLECGEDTIKAYELLKPYIAYLHIKDADKKTKTIVPAGKGDGELPTILKDLDSSGYCGFLSLEPHLTDFAALNTLEQDAAKRGRTDGPSAFRCAYAALKAVLNGTK